LNRSTPAVLVAIAAGEPMVPDITFFVSVRWSPTGSYLMALVNSLAG